MIKTVCFILLLISFSIYGQKKLQISGGIDFYYGLNPMDLNQEVVPIYVSSNQLNSASINLGLVELNYKPSERTRLLISPASRHTPLLGPVQRSCSSVYPRLVV